MVGIQELRSHLLSLTKAGPWLYPADQKSDQSDLNRVEDIIRSELYAAIKVPYSIKQVNAGWTELEDGVLRIDQNLVVDRPGLKVIKSVPVSSCLPYLLWTLVYSHVTSIILENCCGIGRYHHP